MKNKTVMARKEPAIKVTVTQHILSKAPESKSFTLKDGRKIRNVLELVDELETMTEDNFKHFVTETENHFANWIEGVFDTKDLARELRTIHTRMDTQRAILKKLVRELIKTSTTARPK